MKDNNFLKSRRSRRYGVIFGIFLISLLMIITAVSSLAMMITNEQNNNSFGDSFAASIWTTDEYGNPKDDFSPGENVYIHGIYCN